MTRLIYYKDELKREMKGCFNLCSLKEHNLFLSHDDKINTLKYFYFNLDLLSQFMFPNFQTKFRESYYH